jgi:hypothetical protein
MRIRIRDPGIFLTLDLGSGMEKIQIRNKYHESATLVDHYWSQLSFFLLVSAAGPCFPTDERIR